MSVRDYNATPSSNTTIASVNIAEGCSPAGINNAIRQQMADIKDVSVGTVALESPKFDSILDGNIKATDASGTDTAGTATTIKGGAGTGTGAGGSIIFQVADGAGSTGSSVNAHSTAMTITDSGNVDIGGSLLVDTINEKTTGNGVSIPGHVIQIVSQNFTSGASTTTYNTFVATGKSVSITPTSSSNKILLLGSIPIHAVGISSGAHAIFSIFRGGVASGTNLGNASFGMGQVYSTSGDNIVMLSLNHIDTPATTSSVTYEIGITQRNGGITSTNLCVNNETYNITLMEIAQ